MSSKNEEVFQKALEDNSIPMDPSFVSQLYSTIHYLYPTVTKSKETPIETKPIQKINVDNSYFISILIIIEGK